MLFETTSAVAVVLAVSVICIQLGHAYEASTISGSRITLTPADGLIGIRLKPEYREVGYDALLSVHPELVRYRAAELGAGFRAYRRLAAIQTGTFLSATTAHRPVGHRHSS